MGIRFFWFWHSNEIFYNNILTYNFYVFHLNRGIFLLCDLRYIIYILFYPWVRLNMFNLRPSGVEQLVPFQVYHNVLSEIYYSLHGLFTYLIKIILFGNKIKKLYNRCEDLVKILVESKRRTSIQSPIDGLVNSS